MRILPISMFLIPRLREQISSRECFSHKMDIRVRDTRAHMIIALFFDTWPPWNTIETVFEL